ncbi:DoxX family protein [Streptomyces sp. CB03238]|uniref:DoxX family protein n=1 Tax=Streptomyces sp. CB03238 TaxID=1907777 RepID=UPI000D1BAC4D|nr:DoxX family protein [Streptomyces sp. CB03238]
MFIAYAVVAGALALVLTASATFTYARNDQITGSMTKLGVPDTWLPALATAKAAGAAGLLLGLVVPFIGSAAAIGVVLYFLGAVLTHIRARDYALAPAAVLTLAAGAALILRIGSM